MTKAFRKTKKARRGKAKRSKTVRSKTVRSKRRVRGGVESKRKTYTYTPGEGLTTNYHGGPIHYSSKDKNPVTWDNITGNNYYVNPSIERERKKKEEEEEKKKALRNIEYQKEVEEVKRLQAIEDEAYKKKVVLATKEYHKRLIAEAAEAKEKAIADEAAEAAIGFGVNPKNVVNDHDQIEYTNNPNIRKSKKSVDERQDIPKERKRNWYNKYLPGLPNLPGFLQRRSTVKNKNRIDLREPRASAANKNVPRTTLSRFYDLHDNFETNNPNRSRLG